MIINNKSFVMFISALLTSRRSGKAQHKSKRNRMKWYGSDEYIPKDGEIVYGTWARSECFKVERGLLTFGYCLLLILVF